MAGTIIVDTINSSVASTPPVFQANGTEVGTLCRAWVNFDGTGTFSPNPSTTKIRASFNVSSITDNGTGDYTVNFTTAMPDADYSAISTTGNDDSTADSRVATANLVFSTSSIRLQTHTSSARLDRDSVSVAIFR
jgi:hypothetical protein